MRSRKNLTMFSRVLILSASVILMSAGSKAAAITNIQSDPFIFEQLHTHYRFENDGTGYKQIVARIRILNEAGAARWSELSFEFQPSRERVELLYVHMLKSDGQILSIETDR